MVADLMYTLRLYDHFLSSILMLTVDIFSLQIQGVEGNIMVICASAICSWLVLASTTS